MNLENTPQQQQLRAELRSYFAELLQPEVREAIRMSGTGYGDDEAYRAVIRALGRDGWLTIGWPEEYGGQGRGPMEQLVFFEEALLASIPLPFVTINTVGPALMAHGTEQQKRQFLPGIAAGELHFAIGYSEPNAGSDLAALQTRAVREGDNYVINGTKSFTSGANRADYIWLAARTDPDADRPHKGITIFIVDTASEGFSYAPIHTVGDARTNMTYYQDVLCPASMICGEANQGWKLITSQLNHERVGLAAVGVRALDIYDRVLAWARESMTGGARPIDTPWIQQTLAQCYSRLGAMRIMNSRMGWMMEQGQPDPAYASAIKAYSTECLIEVYRLLMDVLGPASTLKRGSHGAQLQGELEHQYRLCQINTFGGGVAELMRDLVASFGLQMNAFKR